MRPALLVVDIQNAWLDQSPELRSSIERRVSLINDAIKLFRSRGKPLIFISHEDKKTGVVPGSTPFEFPSSIEIREGDVRVTKRYPNSFCKTGLDSMLRKLDIDTVVIAGLSASGCVLGTFFGAIDCDFSPYLLKNGVASHSEDHVRFAEEICDTIPLKELEAQMH